MLRTAFHGTPWREIPPHELAGLAQSAGLEGVVLGAEMASQSVTGGALVGDLMPLAALRIDTLDATAFTAASGLASRCGAKVLILRPTFDTSCGHDFSPWRELGDGAARRGQTVAVDLAGNDQFDARAMSKFIQDLAHERVRLCFDLGTYANSHPFSHWEVALQRVVAEVAVLWLADATGTSGDTMRPPLGEGTIDFLRVNEIVRSMRLDALAVIDVEPPRRGRGTITQHCAHALSQSTQHLRRCGWFDP